MEPTNARRIARALEVCIGSGRPFSSFGPGLEGYGESRVVQIGLRWDREALTQRIVDRVAVMLDAGLLDEVRRLRAVSPPWSRTASQALGYRELAAFLDGAVSYDEAVEQIRIRTRQFAVRQDRWFRRDPRIRWIDVHHDPVGEALPVVLEAVGA
jgi:tRNA dimethylallyltransferase